MNGTEFKDRGRAKPDKLIKLKNKSSKSASELILQQEQIDAIMISIMPGFFHMFFKRYTSLMVKQYIHTLRDEN
jgi:hypothetical protein